MITSDSWANAWRWLSGKRDEPKALTARDLATATGATIERATAHLPHIVAAMDEYGIDTPARKAAFFATIGHESGGLWYMTELWGPTPAQARYEGRLDLGNTEPGDGYRFRGRGLIQITGRANYEAMSRELIVDLVSSPELLGKLPLSDRSAACWWKSNGCNAFADAGDFDGVCDRVNRGHKTARIGDANGYAERLALWEKSKEILA